MVTDEDFKGQDKWQFEDRLRKAVREANYRGPGDDQQPPWEVIMEAVIALKHELER